MKIKFSFTREDQKIKKDILEKFYLQIRNDWLRAIQSDLSSFTLSNYHFLFNKIQFGLEELLGIIHGLKTQWKQEFQHERPTDGEKFWARMEAMEQIFHLLLLQWDSHQKRMKEGHARSLADEWTVLNHSPSLIFLKDLEGRYIFANPSFVNFLGKPMEEDILGKTDEDLFSPEVTKQLFLHDQKVYQKKKEECWEETNGGHTFLSTRFPLLNSLGEIVALGGILTDITSRKRVEDSLRLAKEELANCVRERTDELERIQMTRDIFISIASHELKTPMTVIKLQAQLLKRLFSHEPIAGWSSHNAPKIQNSLSQLDNQLNQMIRIIEDMLDFSLIQGGKFKLQCEKLDLSLLVKQVIEKFHSRFSDVGCQVETAIGNLVVGSWDPTRMEQVISNFLENALRYAPGKSIRVSLTQDQALGEAILTVEDEGMGINKENLQSIFGRFERGDIHPYLSGMGIGLYIVENIIKAHGGTVKAESEIGKGAKFIVRLPLFASPNQ